jgi:hypothetical protein
MGCCRHATPDYEKQPWQSDAAGKAEYGLRLSQDALASFRACGERIMWRISTKKTTNFVFGTAAFWIVLCLGSQLHAQCGPGGSVGISSSTGLLSALNTVNTGFMTQTNAFVVVQSSSDRDQLVGGVWARAIGGELKVDSAGPVTFTAPAGTFPCSSRGELKYTGAQFGLDLGKLSLGGGAANFYFGLTGGSVQADGGEIGGPATVELNVPFGGVYIALISGGFFADVLARVDFYDVRASQFQVGLDNQGFRGQAFTVSGSAGYHHSFGSWFIEPSMALIAGRLKMDPLSVPGNAAFAVPAGSMVFRDINTLLGRAGVRIGTTIKGDNYVLQPFVGASFWREFADDAELSFVSGGVTMFSLMTSRVESYTQYIAGISGQLPGSGWAGYARLDFRQGEDIEAWGVNAGLRYQFK